jgi:hypothetical protein
MENQPNQVDFFHIVNMQASNSFGYKGNNEQRKMCAMVAPIASITINFMCNNL